MRGAGTSTTTSSWGAAVSVRFGTYTSNVFDAGAAADWGLPSWTAAVPSGTTLALSARWGDTPSPDASWTAFAPLSNEAPLDVRARYMQWRAELASSGDGARTPRLENLSLPYTVVRNADPVARDDDFALDEDKALQGDVVANDSDADGDTLTVSPGTGPEHGTMTLEADGTFEYAPAADFHGNDHFTYTVSDGQGGTDSAEVTIEVRPVNDLPSPTMTPSRSRRTTSSRSWLRAFSKTIPTQTGTR